MAQELWALFAVDQAICHLIGAAVDATGIPTEKISFSHALAAATATVTAFPPWPARPGPQGHWGDPPRALRS